MPDCTVALDDQLTGQESHARSLGEGPAALSYARHGATRRFQYHNIRVNRGLTDVCETQLEAMEKPQYSIEPRVFMLRVSFVVRHYGLALSP
jgi:hypothetical protein